MCEENQLCGEIGRSPASQAITDSNLVSFVSSGNPK